MNVSQIGMHVESEKEHSYRSLLSTYYLLSYTRTDQVRKLKFSRFGIASTFSFVPGSQASIFRPGSKTVLNGCGGRYAQAHG